MIATVVASGSVLLNTGSVDRSKWRWSLQGPMSGCAGCAAGTYGTQIGMVSCTSCAAGNWGVDLAASNSAVCVPCGDGTYSATVGASSALTCQTFCPAGTYEGAAKMLEPTSEPTPEPTQEPTTQPTSRPTTQPTARPTRRPTARPTPRPSGHPSSQVLCAKAFTSLDYQVLSKLPLCVSFSCLPQLLGRP